MKKFFCAQEYTRILSQYCKFLSHLQPKEFFSVHHLTFVQFTVSFFPGTVEFNWKCCEQVAFFLNVILKVLTTFLASIIAK